MFSFRGAVVKLLFGSDYDQRSASLFPASPIGDCIPQFHDPSPNTNNKPNPTFKVSDRTRSVI